jgi:hypothetical protein
LKLKKNCVAALYAGRLSIHNGYYSFDRFLTKFIVVAKKNNRALFALKYYKPKEMTLDQKKRVDGP